MRKKKKDTTIATQTKCNISTFRSSIRHVAVEKSKENNVLSFYACDIAKDIGIKELPPYTKCSRIDVSLDSGDVFVWKIKYKPKPDLYIPNAIKV